MHVAPVGAEKLFGDGTMAGDRGVRIDADGGVSVTVVGEVSGGCHVPENSDKVR
jgi:hypothetical protein